MPHPWPIFTRQDRLKETMHWLASQANAPVWERYEGSVKDAELWRDIQQAIYALGVAPPLDVIDEILGDPSFTRHQCDECAELVDVVIRLGEDPPDYDMNTIDICIACLNKAVVQLEDHG